MTMECAECREDMLKKISDNRQCAAKKISKTQFGVAVSVVAGSVMVYLLSLTWAVGDCADEHEFQTFQKTMIRQSEEIKGSVARIEEVIEKYISRTEKRDEKQECDIDALDKRVRDVERGR